MSISSLNLLTTFAMAKDAYYQDHSDSHFPARGGGNLFVNSINYSTIESKIDAIVRSIGMYPILFFKLSPELRQCVAEHHCPVKSNWTHFFLEANHIYPHAQGLFCDSYAFLQNHSHDFMRQLFRLEPINQTLLLQHKAPVLVLAATLTHIGRPEPMPLTKPAGQFDEPYYRLLHSDLPHAIVASILQLTRTRVRQLRSQINHPVKVRRHDGSQIRALERNTMHRFMLFLAVHLFKHFRHFGLSTIQAFVQASKMVRSMPTLKAHLTDEFHLSTNLFYWLYREGHFANSPCRSIQEEELAFPPNLLALFHLNEKSTLPTPKKCAQFTIPQWATPENKKLLHAVNIAVMNDEPLRPILIRYCEDGFR